MTPPVLLANRGGKPSAGYADRSPVIIEPDEAGSFQLPRKGPWKTILVGIDEFRPFQVSLFPLPCAGSHMKPQQQAFWRNGFVEMFDLPAQAFSVPGRPYNELA